MPAGHYFVLDNSDDSYAYKQYFVVLPGSRWESVDYGARPASPNVVCKIERTRGTYRVKDSAVTMVPIEGGASEEKCPVTQADFDGLTWEAAPAGLSHAFSIRNVTDTSFEAEKLLTGLTGWRTYRKVADPHGYFD